MITFITHMRVSRENAAALESILSEMCTKVREHEPGVAYYSFARDVKDPNIYVLIEVYWEKAALRAHAQTDHFKALLPKSTALVEGGRFDTKQYVSALGDGGGLIAG